MKKKTLLFVFLFAILCAMLACSICAEEIDLKQRINDYIKAFYNYEYDYYADNISVDINDDGKKETLGLYTSGRQEEIEKYGYLLNPLTYVENPLSFSGTKEININPNGKNGNYWKNHKTDIIGYDKFGNAIIPYVNSNNARNADFYKWTHGWVDNRLCGKPTPESGKSSGVFLMKYTSNKLIKWMNSDKCNWDESSRKAFSDTSYSLKKLNSIDTSGEKARLLEEAIQKGIDTVYSGVKGSMLDTSNYHKNWILHVKGDSPDIGSWGECLLIVVPPTDISWGLGWRINDSTNGTGKSYLTVEIPIAPFNMLLDISTEFVNSTGNANPGDTVQFTAEVNSTPDQEVKDVSYKWVVTDLNGNPISGVSYGGHGNSSSGKFTKEKNKTMQFVAQFVMPETAVNVTFEINDNKKLNESNFENNKAVATVGVLMPVPDETSGEVILDYDIYSRDYNDNLAAMTATFGHSGAITATMGVSSQNTSILSYYGYQTNATGSGSSITVRPWYKSILYRSGFGDIPENKVYLPNGIYPLMIPQKANGSATVKWKETHSYTDAEGNSHSYTVTRRQTSSFPTTTTNLPVTAYVYNGGPVNQPATRNEVVRTDLAWTSNIIPFEVYRHMYHQDVNNNKVNQKNIPGQYVRNFVDQNTASVIWSTPLTQTNAYAADRRTAANRGAQYQNAIFATDKEFARVDYPVKSGYMFNPLGTYQCVVNSTVYYDISASEWEKKQTHEELVNKVINSFVYDNQLQYTNDGKDDFVFRNVTNNNNVKGILNIARRDNATITTIPHTQYQKCMEGWEESYTLPSWNNYKYREYVKEDRVSRIDAQTVLTFTIGSNIKRYTYINMRDGQYAITAKSLPFSFKGLTAPGVHLNDGITVTVRGSLYDDRG